MPPPSITCPKCRMTSYNGNDIRLRYCGNCHAFHDSVPDAIKLLEWLADHGGAQGAAAMHMLEVALGYRIVPVGSVPWLPPLEWQLDSVVSQKGRVVRLVAISARAPYTGAFKRMIEGIHAARLVPVVVCPIFAAMPTIMKKWGWIKFNDPFGNECWSPKGDPHGRRSRRTGSKENANAGAGGARAR